MKVLLLLALFGILIYLFWRRFTIAAPQTTLSKVHRSNSFLVVESSSSVIAKATRSTLWTVAIGFLLLLVILIIGIKIKIVWIVFPLSLYLIGQLLVYTNHVRTIKDQRIFFDPQTGEVLVDFLKKESFSFNIKKDIVTIKEIKSVQKNRDTLFGYYKINTRRGEINIPYLLEHNGKSINGKFFEHVHVYKRVVETKLFPIIG